LKILSSHDRVFRFHQKREDLSWQNFQQAAKRCQCKRQPLSGEKAMKKKLVNISLIKQPSAFLPLAMSLTALILVLGHAAIFGIVHEADEGAAAHIWQILMAVQLPILAYFTLKWLPRRPKESLQVLILLAATWLANFAAVYWLT